MKTVQPTTLDVDTRRVLSNVRCDDNLVYLPPGQLDRKLYLGVNKVLEELGGKWNRQKKAHVFTDNPAARLDAVVETGELLFAKQLGYFPTPFWLAKDIVKRAGVRDGSRVLEPSAGTGAIAKEAKEAGGVVHCVEIDESRRKLLTAQGFEAELADFLKLHYAAIFDAIVMNPPFGFQQDIDHVQHAYRVLRTGGTLVSVMAGSVLFRDNKKTTEFREMVWRCGGLIEDLPDSTFADVGTHVKTVLVTIPSVL